MSDERYTCAYCGAAIPLHVIARRHHSEARRERETHYCNREHQVLERKQGNEFKVMSAAGRDARSAAVAKSNQEYPRRKKKRRDITDDELQIVHTVWLNKQEE